MIDRCHLVKRGHMYDVYINGKNYGSGQVGYIETAYAFYKMEGMDVEIVYE